MTQSPALTSIDIAAHDLRNAIGLMHAGVQLMADAAEPDSADAAMAADLRRADDQLGWFIDRVIEAARDELGRPASDVVIELSAVLDAAIRRARRHQAGLTVAISGDTPPGDVCIDPAAAERLIADSILLVGASGTVDVSCMRDANGWTLQMTGVAVNTPLAASLRTLANSSAARWGVTLSDHAMGMTLGFPLA